MAAALAGAAASPGYFRATSRATAVTATCEHLGETYSENAHIERGALRCSAGRWVRAE